MAFVFVTESQLDAWVRAHPVEATTLIPDLINRLVSKSCPNAKEMRFPFGDSIGQPGADGFLSDEEGFPPFFPSGDSYWEIGTGPAATKATDDYRKRTEAIDEATRRDSKIVIVNPRSAAKEWRDSKGNNTQKAWVEKRRSKGEWGGIALIDGTIITNWILRFPDVGMWLAERVVGLPKQHIDTVERHWKLLQAFGGPNPLAPDLFLGNRRNAIQRLKELSHSEPKDIRLHTNFPHQVVDFVCAFIASLEENQRVVESGRTLIVSDPTAWSSVCEIYQGANLVLVATPSLYMSGESGLRRIQEARVCGHSVIYDAPPGGVDEDLTHRLQNPRNSDIYESLKSSGIAHQRARAIADKCDRNIGQALKLLHGESFLPAWAEVQHSDVLVYAFLAGAWDHNSIADREILQELTGQDYTDWCRQLRRHVGGHNPPVVELDGRWKFVSRLDGWNALGRLLDEVHLRRLQRAASMALFVDKFQIELEDEEYIQLVQEEKHFNISPELQRGLVEVLALMGSYPNVPTSMSRGQVEQFVTRTVQEVLRGSENIRWMMSNSTLPLLAEASPTGFLDVVEGAVEQGGVLLGESDLLGGKGTHGTALPHGLVWALQSLAWSQEYLSRACVLLGRLLEHELLKNEEGYSLRALSQILFPLLPQTQGSSQDRLDTVRLLLRETPNTGWRLLLSLFPAKGGFVTTNYRPVWREIVSDDWEPKVVSQRELNYQLESLSKLLVETVREDYEKLSDNDFIELLPDISPTAFDETLGILSSPFVTERPHHHRLTLWKRLAALHRRHAEFVDAVWSLDKNAVLELGRVIDAIGPNDPKTVLGLVFSNDVRLLVNNSERDIEDWKMYEEEKELLRRQTLKKALDHYGLKEAIALAKNVDDPGAFGYHLAEYASFESDRLLLSERLTLPSSKNCTEIIRAYVQRRQHLQGWKWLDSIDRSYWTPAQTGTLLGWMPFVPETWNRAESWLGRDDKEYWERTHPLVTKEHETDYDVALRKLIQFRRRDAAISLLAGLCIQERTFDTRLAYQVLLLETPHSQILEQETIYKIDMIIKTLQSCQDLLTKELLEVEWKYLGLLRINSSFSPVTVERQLSSAPAYFCEIAEIHNRLRSIPRAELSNFGSLDVDIHKNIHQMIDRHWRVLPGMFPDGEFRSNVFEEWIDEVYRLCGNAKLLETAQDFIGEALLHAPPDPDGLWIHKSIANALNDRRAQTMRHAYYMATRNSRGVYRVEGTGAQERELAQKFRTRAEHLRDAGFDRLASTLESVSRSYDIDSEYAIRRDEIEN